MKDEWDGLFPPEPVAAKQILIHRWGTTDHYMFLVDAEGRLWYLPLGDVFGRAPHWNQLVLPSA